MVKEIKEVKAYRTSDGKLFENMSIAENHQILICNRKKVDGFIDLCTVGSHWELDDDKFLNYVLSGDIVLSDKFTKKGN